MLGKSFDDNSPLFLQIKERIEDMIMNGGLLEEEQVPSTTQIVQFYKINHITVSKGVNLLVDNKILYKKRGVGVFVSTGAKNMLLNKRQESFVQDYMVPMLKEAKNLGIELSEIIKMVQEVIKNEQ